MNEGDRNVHPNLSRMLRKAMEDIYDRLGLCVFCSIVWSVCVVFAGAWAFGLIAPFGPAIAFVFGCILVGPLTLGLYHVAGAVSTGEDAYIGDLLRGMWKYYTRGMGLFAVNAVFLSAAVLTIYFYTAQLSGAVFKLIGILWLYAVAMWLLGQLFCPAFIVRQDVGVLTSIKRSLILVIDNLGYGFTLAVQIGLVLVLVCLPVMLLLKPVVPLSFMIFFLILPAFVAVLGMNAFDDLMQKYHDDSGRNHTWD